MVDNCKPCIESIRRKASEYYSLKVKTTNKRKAEAYKQLYNRWQSCLEVAEEIYHSGASDAEERIKALKMVILI
jgi:hypothetical protein